LVMEWAGRSRTTATGLFAGSNHIGGSLLLDSRVLRDQ